MGLHLDAIASHVRLHSVVYAQQACPLSLLMIAVIDVQLLDAKVGKVEAAIDWADRQARAALLAGIVEDADRLLELSRQAQVGIGRRQR